MPAEKRRFGTRFSLHMAGILLRKNQPARAACQTDKTRFRRESAPLFHLLQLAEKTRFSEKPTNPTTSTPQTRKKLVFPPTAATQDSLSPGKRPQGGRRKKLAFGNYIPPTRNTATPQSPHSHKRKKLVLAIRPTPFRFAAKGRFSPQIRPSSGPSPRETSPARTGTVLRKKVVLLPQPISIKAPSSYGSHHRLRVRRAVKSRFSYPKTHQSTVVPGTTQTKRTRFPHARENSLYPPPTLRTGAKPCGKRSFCPKQAPSHPPKFPRQKRYQPKASQQLRKKVVFLSPPSNPSYS